MRNKVSISVLLAALLSSQLMGHVAAAQTTRPTLRTTPPGTGVEYPPRREPIRVNPDAAKPVGDVAIDETHYTPRHTTKLASVSSAIMSPDGTHIAYVKYLPRDPYEVPTKNDPDFEDGSPRSELHVIRISDGKDMLFIGRYSPFGGVKWRPDSSGISFTAKRTPDKERSLYVLSLEGGEARRVLAHETGIDAYALSPQGDRVAFTSTAEEPKAIADLKKKGFKAEVYEEIHRESKLWIARIGELPGEPFGDADSLDLDGNIMDPSWSPDGLHLAVKVSPTPLTDDKYMASRVQIVDVGARKVATRIENPGKLGQVEWSPDGKNLAMISAEDLNDPAEGRLLIVSSEGGAMRDVLPDFLGHVKSIAWQDADTVMYLADIGTETIFAKVDVDGSSQKTIVPATAGETILDGISLSDDGLRGAFIGNSRLHPNEVFLMKHGDEGLKRLTDSNPWLGILSMARQESITYKARDGLEIGGVLIHPLDEKPGKRYPLIVSVHGGPEAHESDGWITNYSRPGQAAAARGYAVFYPNYRGSTGRGVAFSKLDQADYAGAEFDDIVDGIRHLVSIGLVDEKKVGVTGGSYGGYASAWCATKLTEHFAASVMFVGITDLISKVGTTDIPNEMYLVHARRWPWEGHWDWFRERSPLYHADQSKTPLLILHGKDDPRVHPSQSMELYRFMKTIGKTPVRLVLYPGEGHGNSKAAARLDYNLRMLQWFDHYLKGPGGTPPGHDIEFDLPKKNKEGKETTTAPAELP
ncbi:MAG: S9 family peptidase [Planctomycetes bacterium]|nr:S9 family peptidase [Planctomycetota bacterium]